MHINLHACDGPTLAGLLTQSGGDPSVQRRILRIFAEDKERRGEIADSVWLYIYRVLPKDLKSRVSPFIIERRLQVSGLNAA